MTSSVDLVRYRAARAALVCEDRAQRADHARGALSTSEAKADQILRGIRATEAVSIWGADHDDIPHTFPGMEFLTGRRLVVQTKVFEILTKMPKGALLHAHLGATVDAASLLKLALKYPAIHVRTPNVVNNLTMQSTMPEFRALSLDQFSDGSGLTEDSYPPNTYVSLRKARETFDLGLGGPEGFDRWVIDAMRISPAEAYGTHNTTVKVWRKFTSSFRVVTGLICFAPVWEDYLREFLLTSVEDGISYVEIRINFFNKYLVGADGRALIPHREWLVVFDRVQNEVKAEMTRQDREGDFIGAKIIYTTVRFITPEELEWYTEDCITLKQEFPHLIAGFDLVGDENVLKPIIYYIEPLLKFRARTDALGLDIPFIFHAGETLGDGTEADDNLYDAILLGSKRIGHGFSIVKHPKLMQICKEKGIALEVCPISNEVLRLTSSMPMHPLPILLNGGVPVCLSSDDPAIFGSMGLTYDFYQVFVASELTGLIALGEMARDSLKYSTLGPEEKRLAIQLWKKKWAAFVDEVALIRGETSG